MVTHKEKIFIPGIVGVIGPFGRSKLKIKSEFEKSFYWLTNNPYKFVKSKIETPFGIVGIVKRNKEDISRDHCSAENNRFMLLGEGEYFDENGKRIEIEDLLQKISKNSITYFDTLNGNYCIVIYDKQNKTLHLQTDRYSTRLMYYFYKNDSLIFSNDIRFVICHDSVELEINYNSVFDLLNYEFILCNETLYKSIYTFPHGKCAIWDGQKLSFKRYWDYPQKISIEKKFTFDEYKEETTFRVRESIKRKLYKKSSVIITLSAGLDSRSIAAFVKVINTTDFELLHLGHPKDKATIWSKMIAKKLDKKINIININNLEYKELMKYAVDLTNGQISINQALIFWLLISAGINNRYVLDGQLQDVLLKSLYITHNYKDSVTPENTIKIINNIYPHLHDNFIKLVLKKEWHEKAIKYRNERILDHVKGKNFDDLSALTQYYYCTTRGQRYVWGATSLEFAAADVGFPGMDYDLFDWAMSIPIEFRDPGAELYRAMICGSFPEISKIPWDATGKPLVFPRLRTQNDLNIFEKKFLFHMIRRLSLGKIDLLATNFNRNRLFRKNKFFQSAILDALSNINNDSKNPFYYKGIMKLIKMISNGRDYCDILLRICTLTTFFNSLDHEIREKKFRY